MPKATLNKPVSVDKKQDKPRSPAEWCAYRCQLSCKIGRDALEGKTQPPAGFSPLEYAVFNLLHAVEECLMIGSQNARISDRADITNRKET